LLPTTSPCVRCGAGETVWGADFDTGNETTSPVLSVEA